MMIVTGTAAVLALVDAILPKPLTGCISRHYQRVGDVVALPVLLAAICTSGCRETRVPTVGTLLSLKS